MSLNSMHRQVEKLSVEIHQHLPSRKSTDLAEAFMWDLYTPDEQERLLTFMDQVQPKIKRSRTGGLDLNDLTVEEKDALESWIVFHQSLESGDTAQAERCRRYLLLTPEDKERIYSAFMAIDESRFPVVSHCTDAPSVEWDRCTHYIYRGGLQWNKDHMKQHKAYTGYLRRWEIDGMWLWLEQAAQLESRGLLV